ncbi:MAG: hypothetical protein ABI614_23735 [Planctomycetota bacterium]
MSEAPIELSELERRVKHGDQEALAELFERNRTRLKQMVLFRLDQRLPGRVDASDVLQDAYVDVASPGPQEHDDQQPLHSSIETAQEHSHRLLEFGNLEIPDE